ncbi:hypothetical protein PtA15_4A700 [Puccinia triticina]|uniref:Calponin-homology (CH) domain-containing protein n=1 Tax=Puccinia triticina TaxID=208348 RepID=A0ABY7CID6_9BASI|nr:uncharacterized protein PtA15_4A700 [Puccinia triticina]WAQ84247.1 hypothetical protein PtA15_4A700 [Puccinia triticina]
MLMGLQSPAHWLAAAAESPNGSLGNHNLNDLQLGAASGPARRPPPRTSRAPSAEASTEHAVPVALQTDELSASDQDLLSWINNKIRARKSATTSEFSGSIRNSHVLVRLIEALTRADSSLSIRDFLGASHLTQLELHRPAGPDTPSGTKPQPVPFPTSNDSHAFGFELELRLGSQREHHGNDATNTAMKPIASKEFRYPR